MKFLIFIFGSLSLFCQAYGALSPQEEVLNLHKKHTHIVFDEPLTKESRLPLSTKMPKNNSLKRFSKKNHMSLVQRHKNMATFSTDEKGNGQNIMIDFMSFDNFPNSEESLSGNFTPFYPVQERLQLKTPQQQAEDILINQIVDGDIHGKNFNKAHFDLSSSSKPKQNSEFI